MENPFFSIITVVYNGEEEIESTINSVLNQTFKDFEYIVIDGNSTDKTLKKIKKFSNRLVWISENDNGIYDAMNKGIKLAKGKIVGILNCGDTFLSNDILHKIFLKFKQENIESNSHFIITGGLRLINHKTKKYRDLKISIDSVNRLKYFMSIFHPSTFISNQTYIDYGAFNDKYQISGDYDLILRFYNKGVRFFLIDDILVEMDQVGLSTKFKGVIISTKETFNIRSRSSKKINYIVNIICSFKAIIGYFYSRIKILK